MLNAYIYAYCQKNLGDDMFVLALVRRYPQIMFRCSIAPDDSHAFLNEPNLKLPGALEFFIRRVLNKLRLLPIEKQQRISAHHSDMVIRIGGSIFIEPPAWYPDSSKNNNYNEIVIGANFGPYQTEAFFANTKASIKDCIDVCFRDQYSYNMFRQIGHVRYAPDVLFGYKFYPDYLRGNGVGISVIAAHERENLVRWSQGYYETIAAACDLFLEQNIPVTLFAFCEKEGDVRAIDEIKKRMINRNAIQVSVYEGDVDSFLAEINDCEYMIATRFHAMILAWTMGKKVLPVIYSQKQSHVLDDLAYHGYVWNLLGGELPDAAEVVNRCLSAENTLDVDSLAKNAEKQFAGIDLFLNKKGREKL